MGCLLAPFAFVLSAAGALFLMVLSLVGRLIGFLLGAALATAGVCLSLTGIGLLLGVPLTLFGGALAFRALF